MDSDVIGGTKNSSVTFSNTTKWGGDVNLVSAVAASFAQPAVENTKSFSEIGGARDGSSNTNLSDCQTHEADQMNVSTNIHVTRREMSRAKTKFKFKIYNSTYLGEKRNWVYNFTFTGNGGINFKK